MTVRWRVYYDNGSTFSNEDGTPEQSPAFGVICIVSTNDLIGRIILHKHDWYWWIADEKVWFGGDIFGLLDRLLHRLSTEAILQGRTVPNEAFRDTMGRADKDEDFPPKSGRLMR